MLGHYLAVTLRNLKRAPGAAAVNVVTLALGQHLRGARPERFANSDFGSATHRQADRDHAAAVRCVAGRYRCNRVARRG